MSARPIKRGLDYFPIDVDMDDDTAVCVLEGTHGVEGFGIFVKLLMRIYRHGYYLPWDDRECVVFARRSGADYDTVAAVVRTAFAEGLFHLGMFEKYGIITSSGIQKRYFTATKKRQTGVSDAEYLVSDAETPVSGVRGTQSKGKERKGERPSARGDDLVSRDVTPGHTGIAEIGDIIHDTLGVMVGGGQDYIKISSLLDNYSASEAIERVRYGCRRASESSKGLAYALKVATDASKQEITGSGKKPVDDDDFNYTTGFRR